MTVLLQPPECWNYRHAALCPAETQVLAGDYVILLMLCEHLYTELYFQSEKEFWFFVVLFFEIVSVHVI